MLVFIIEPSIFTVPFLLWYFSTSRPLFDCDWTTLTITVSGSHRSCFVWFFALKKISEEGQHISFCSCKHLSCRKWTGLAHMYELSKHVCFYIRIFLPIALHFHVTHWAWDLCRWTPEVPSNQCIHAHSFSTCSNWVPQDGKAWLKLQCPHLWVSRVAARLHVTLKSVNPKVHWKRRSASFWSWFPQR